MQATELSRAVAAATSTVSALDLRVDGAIVLRDANRLVLRLMPCDVVVRVAPLAFRAGAQLEVELAQRLTETASPVVGLDPRFEPRVHLRDGFVMNMWTYHEPVSPRQILPADYAHALERLHAGMRQIGLATPHFTDRVAEAQLVVDSPEESPGMADADRELLSNMLRRLKQAIGDRGAAEQLLHGEPHPGNVLETAKELLFLDLETCCRGPVEFDIAHVPEEVSRHYACADHEVVGECRGLILAMVAAWRWQRGDHDPGGLQAGLEVLRALREGPPWPALDVIGRRLDGS
jgi:Phosphotransferase enzyme family